MKIRKPKLRAGLFSLAAASACALASTSWAQTVSLDTVGGYEGVFQNAAQFTAATDRPHAAGANYAYDATGAGGVMVDNADFLTALNAATGSDVLAFSFWAKKYDIANNSAFWVFSPTAGGGGRTAQAHLPWSNNQIYFDTAGCCDGATQRINAGIDTFAGYTGDNTWWEDWHHYVFVKDGSTKTIYIDGQVFLTGENTGALATDNTVLWIGTNGDGSGNYLHGQMDDFAVFANALSPADVTALFGGTAPDALGGATLLAYWPFDDPPTFGPLAGSPVGFSLTANDAAGRELDENTVAVTLDGATVTPTVNKAGLATTIEYLLPNPPFEAGSSHDVTVSIDDTGATTYTTTQSFMVANYATLPADLALAPGDVGPRGMKLRGYQVDDTQPDFVSPGNGVKVANDILDGKYGPSVAATWGVGPDGFWTWGDFTANVYPGLNLHTAGPGGNFVDPDHPDEPYQFVPGNTGVSTDFACEVYAAVEFPAAGLYEIGVLSDDAFALTAGNNPKDLLTAILVATAEGNGEQRGLVYVNAPGKYPFRLVHQNGGGAGQLEWFTVGADGELTLVDDTAAGGLAAYQWVPTITSAYVKAVTPVIDAAQAGPGLVEATIVDGPTPVDPTTVSLAVDGVDTGATAVKTDNETTISYAPDALFEAGSTHTASLSYTDGGEVKTFEWSFTIAPYTKDVVGAYVGVLEGNAQFLADSARPGAAEGNHAMDFTETGGSYVLVEDASFVNAAAANDVLAFSVWQRAHNLANGSTIYILSPSSSGTQRAFQLHLPWGGTIYFDTAGCCDGGTQRINLAMNADNYPPYTGSEWWNDWHHFYAVKNGENKQIYVDGVLFHEGVNTGVLPTDINQIYFGRDAGANRIHAVIDDAALFDAALSEADIQALAAGTAPDAITGSSSLIAWWPFDDAPVTAVPTIALDGEGNIVFTGVLQRANEANGTYEDVEGATSPYPMPTDADMSFYRSRSE